MKEGFFRGALILLFGSLASRILGFVYRVYIVRLIGAEGIGLYEMVFPLITLILVLTTAGVPVAIAKSIADDRAEGKERKVAITVRLSFFLLTFTGVLFPSMLMYTAPWLVSKVFADPRAYWAFMAIIPALFFVSVSSVLRGYYQGINFMLPSALGQLFEQVIRIVIGITLVFWLLPYGIEFGAAGLALAVVLGEAAGLVTLLFYYRSHRPKMQVQTSEKAPPAKAIIQQLLVLAAPVTASRVVSSLMLSIKAIMIPNRLQAAGATLEQATQAYGAFSGMAMSLLSFPTVITSSLSSVLLPAIATAIAQRQFGQLELRVNQGIKLTVLAALPFTIWFFLLSESLTQGFFHNKEAAISLKLLASGCVFIYLQQTIAGVLYGLGKMKILFVNSLAGNTIGLLVTYSLTGLPLLGIRGACLGVIFGAVIVCCLNLAALFKYAPINLKFKTWAGSAGLAAIIMIIFVTILADKLSLWGILLGSGGSYLLALVALKGLTKADFRSY